MVATKESPFRSKEKRVTTEDTETTLWWKGETSPGKDWGLVEL